MKTIFDETTREEIIARINALNDNKKAVWGTMNVYQMAKHCTLWEEMIQDAKTYKRNFFGRIFGKFVLQSVLKDEKFLRPNTPTLPELQIKETGSVEEQKIKWIARVEKYKSYAAVDYQHVFFGRMTREQVGYLAFKHSDHHLRQFNC